MPLRVTFPLLLSFALKDSIHRREGYKRAENIIMRVLYIYSLLLLLAVCTYMGELPIITPIRSAWQGCHKASAFDV